MSKRAKEAAFKAYPERLGWDYRDMKDYDSNMECRICFRRGYEQAEKDLTLTWEDIQLIQQIFKEVDHEYRNLPYAEIESWAEELNPVEKETLRRFKMKKEEL